MWQRLFQTRNGKHVADCSNLSAISNLKQAAQSVKTSVCAPAEVCVQSGCPGGPGAVLHEAAGQEHTFVPVLLFLIQQIEQISEHWTLFKTWGSLCGLGYSIFPCVSSPNPAESGGIAWTSRKLCLYQEGLRDSMGKWSWGGRGLCLSTCWLLGSPRSPSNLLNVNKIPALFGFWGCFFFSPIPCCIFGAAAIPCAGNLLLFGKGEETPFCGFLQWSQRPEGHWLKVRNGLVSVLPVAEQCCGG